MKSLLLFPFLLLLSLPNCFAQTTDFQTWSTVSLQKSFSKKISVTLQQELRLDDNSTQFHLTFTDAEFKYKLTKWFNATANYRFIVKPDEIDHRIYSDLYYLWKNKKIEAELRLRVQHEFVPNDVDENYLRPKLELSYKIKKKWEPYISEELFYHVLYYKGDKFDESRLSAGTHYDFDKRNSIKAYYMYEQEFNVNDALHAHVLGVAYEYDF